MLMNWTEEYSVGVDKIDNQHKELFDRINMLLIAMKEGKGKVEVMAALKFLEDYVVKHFTEEEEIQQKSNYPKYTIQHEQHEEFKKELNQMKEKFLKEGSSSSLVIQVQQKMTTWWKNHILELDQDLGKHLNKKLT